jgi:hypothetical protein
MEFIDLPEDNVREICLRMNYVSLINFLQTNKFNHEICHDLVDLKKRELLSRVLATFIFILQESTKVQLESKITMHFHSNFASTWKISGISRMKYYPGKDEVEKRLPFIKDEFDKNYRNQNYEFTYEHKFDDSLIEKMGGLDDDLMITDITGKGVVVQFMPRVYLRKEKPYLSFHDLMIKLIKIFQNDYPTNLWFRGFDFNLIMNHPLFDFFYSYYK